MNKDLDITIISKEILKQALTKGYFTLPNSEEIRELTVTQILSLAKAVVKDGLVIDTEEQDNTNLPSDIFTQNFIQSHPRFIDRQETVAKKEGYICSKDKKHKSIYFQVSFKDPLAQIPYCKECKEEHKDKLIFLDSDKGCNCHMCRSRSKI